MLWDYKFFDEDTGEEFFVECETLEEARATVREYFGSPEPRYCGKYTPDEAEILGLDTY